MAKRTKKYILGIDIGGTKMLVALMNSGFEIVSRKKIKADSNKGKDYFFSALTEGIKTLLKEAGVTATKGYRHRMSGNY